MPRFKINFPEAYERHIVAFFPYPTCPDTFSCTPLPDENAGPSFEITRLTELLFVFGSSHGGHFYVEAHITPSSDTLCFAKFLVRDSQFQMREENNTALRAGEVCKCSLVKQAKIEAHIIWTPEEP